jgi:hypothetical protein
MSTEQPRSLVAFHIQRVCGLGAWAVIIRCTGKSCSAFYGVDEAARAPLGTNKRQIGAWEASADALILWQSATLEGEANLKLPQGAAAPVN